MTNTSKIARITAPYELIWEVDEVKEPKEKQIVGRTLASTISPGTEVAAFIGMPPLRPMKVYPRLVGYCNVAVIERAGSGSAFSVGQKVLTHMSHRTRFTCDDDAVLTLVSEDADIFAVSGAYLFHLGYAAVVKGNVSADDDVAVIGLGTLGLTAVAMASCVGAAVDGYSNRQVGMALEMGANSLKKMDEARENGYRVVITTSNSWDDWLLALRIVKTNGTIIVLGFPGRGQPAPQFNPLASEFIYDKQLTISACGAVDRTTMKTNMEWIVGLITAGTLKATPLISETISPTSLASVYQRLADREPGLLTAVLKW